MSSKSGLAPKVDRSRVPTPFMARLGQEAEVVVIVLGYPPPTVRWYVGPNLVKDGEGYSVTSIGHHHRLVIRKVSEELNRGIFVAASNYMGEDSCLLEIKTYQIRSRHRSLTDIRRRQTHCGSREELSVERQKLRLIQRGKSLTSVRGYGTLPAKHKAHDQEKAAFHREENSYTSLPAENHLGGSTQYINQQTLVGHPRYSSIDNVSTEVERRRAPPLEAEFPVQRLSVSSTPSVERQFTFEEKPGVDASRSGHTTQLPESPTKTRSRSKRKSHKKSTTTEEQLTLTETTLTSTKSDQIGAPSDVSRMDMDLKSYQNPQSPSAGVYPVIGKAEPFLPEGSATPQALEGYEGGGTKTTKEDATKKKSKRKKKTASTDNLTEEGSTTKSKKKKKTKKSVDPSTSSMDNIHSVTSVTDDVSQLGNECLAASGDPFDEEGLDAPIPLETSLDYESSKDRPQLWNVSGVRLSSLCNGMLAKNEPQKIETDIDADLNVSSWPSQQHKETDIDADLHIAPRSSYRSLETDIDGDLPTSVAQETNIDDGWNVPHHMPDIGASYHPPGQTETDIDAGYHPPGPTETDIDAGYHPPGQMMTDIDAGYHPPGQMMTDIDAGYHPPGPTETDIDAGYHPPGQMMTDIDVGYHPPGQMMTDIDAGYHPPGQMMTDIDAGYHPPGPTETDIDAGYHPPGQMMTDVDAGYHPPGQMMTDIDAGYHPPGQMMTDIDASYHPPGQMMTDIDAGYHPPGPTETDIDTGYHPPGPTETDIDAGYHPPGQTETHIDAGYHPPGQTETDIDAGYHPPGQMMTDIDAGYDVYNENQSLDGTVVSLDAGVKKTKKSKDGKEGAKKKKRTKSRSNLDSSSVSLDNESIDQSQLGDLPYTNLPQASPQSGVIMMDAPTQQLFVYDQSPIANPYSEESNTFNPDSQNKVSDENPKKKKKKKKIKKSTGGEIGSSQSEESLTDISYDSISNSPSYDTKKVLNDSQHSGMIMTDSIHDHIFHNGADPIEIDQVLDRIEPGGPVVVDPVLDRIEPGGPVVVDPVLDRIEPGGPVVVEPGIMEAQPEKKKKKRKSHKSKDDLSAISTDDLQVAGMDGSNAGIVMMDVGKKEKKKRKSHKSKDDLSAISTDDLQVAGMDGSNVNIVMMDEGTKEKKKKKRKSDKSKEDLSAISVEDLQVTGMDDSNAGIVMVDGVTKEKKKRKSHKSKEALSAISTDDLQVTGVDDSNAGIVMLDVGKKEKKKRKSHKSKDNLSAISTDDLQVAGMDDSNVNIVMMDGGTKEKKKRKSHKSKDDLSAISTDDLQVVGMDDSNAGIVMMDEGKKEKKKKKRKSHKSKDDLSAISVDDLQVAGMDDLSKDVPTTQHDKKLKKKRKSKSREDLVGIDTGSMQLVDIDGYMTASKETFRPNQGSLLIEDQIQEHETFIPHPQLEITSDQPAIPGEKSNEDISAPNGNNFQDVGIDEPIPASPDEVFADVQVPLPMEADNEPVEDLFHYVNVRETPSIGVPTSREDPLTKPVTGDEMPKPKKRKSKIRKSKSKDDLNGGDLQPASQTPIDFDEPAPSSVDQLPDASFMESFDNGLNTSRLPSLTEGSMADESYIAGDEEQPKKVKKKKKLKKLTKSKSQEIPQPESYGDYAQSPLNEAVDLPFFRSPSQQDASETSVVLRPVSITDDSLAIRDSMIYSIIEEKQESTLFSPEAQGHKDVVPESVDEPCVSEGNTAEPSADQHKSLGDEASFVFVPDPVPRKKKSTKGKKKKLAKLSIDEDPTAVSPRESVELPETNGYQMPESTTMPALPSQGDVDMGEADIVPGPNLDDYTGGDTTTSQQDSFETSVVIRPVSFTDESLPVQGARGSLTYSSIEEKELYPPTQTKEEVHDELPVVRDLDPAIDSLPANQPTPHGEEASFVFVPDPVPRKKKSTKSKKRKSTKSSVGDASDVVSQRSSVEFPSVNDNSEPLYLPPAPPVPPTEPLDLPPAPPVPPPEPLDLPPAPPVPPPREQESFVENLDDVVEEDHGSGELEVFIPTDDNVLSTDPATEKVIKRKKSSSKKGRQRSSKAESADFANRESVMELMSKYHFQGQGHIESEISHLDTYQGEDMESGDLHRIKEQEMDDDYVQVPSASKIDLDFLPPEVKVSENEGTIVMDISDVYMIDEEKGSISTRVPDSDAQVDASNAQPTPESPRPQVEEQQQLQSKPELPKKPSIDKQLQSKPELPKKPSIDKTEIPVDEDRKKTNVKAKARHKVGRVPSKGKPRTSVQKQEEGKHATKPVIDNEQLVSKPKDVPPITITAPPEVGIKKQPLPKPSLHPTPALKPLTLDEIQFADESSVSDSDGEDTEKKRWKSMTNIIMDEHKDDKPEIKPKPLRYKGAPLSVWRYDHARTRKHRSAMSYDENYSPRSAGLSSSFTFDDVHSRSFDRSSVGSDVPSVAMSAPAYSRWGCADSNEDIWTASSMRDDPSMGTENQLREAVSEDDLAGRHGWRFMSVDIDIDHCEEMSHHNQRKTFMKAAKSEEVLSKAHKSKYLAVSRMKKSLSREWEVVTTTTKEEILVISKPSQKDEKSNKDGESVPDPGSVTATDVDIGTGIFENVPVEVTITTPCDKEETESTPEERSSRGPQASEVLPDVSNDSDTSSESYYTDQDESEDGSGEEGAHSETSDPCYQPGVEDPLNTSISEQIHSIIDKVRDARTNGDHTNDLNHHHDSTSPHAPMDKCAQTEPSNDPELEHPRKDSVDGEDIPYATVYEYEELISFSIRQETVREVDHIQVPKRIEHILKDKNLSVNALIDALLCASNDTQNPQSFNWNELNKDEVVNSLRKSQASAPATEHKHDSSSDENGLLIKNQVVVAGIVDNVTEVEKLLSCVVTPSRRYSTSSPRSGDNMLFHIVTDDDKGEVKGSVDNVTAEDDKPRDDDDDVDDDDDDDDDDDGSYYSDDDEDEVDMPVFIQQESFSGLENVFVKIVTLPDGRIEQINVVDNSKDQVQGHEGSSDESSSSDSSSENEEDSENPDSGAEYDLSERVTRKEVTDDEGDTKLSSVQDITCEQMPVTQSRPLPIIDDISEESEAEESDDSEESEEEASSQDGLATPEKPRTSSPTSPDSPTSQDSPTSPDSSMNSSFLATKTVMPGVIGTIDKNED